MMGNQDAFKPIYTQISVCIVLIIGGAITLATSPPPDPVCYSDCEPFGPAGEFFEPEVTVTTVTPEVRGRLFLSWPLAHEEAWSQISEQDRIEEIERRNSGAVEQREVLVSFLSPKIVGDCEELLIAPLNYLDESMFVEPTLYTLTRGDVISISGYGHAQMDCNFMNVVGDGLNSTLVSLDLSTDSPLSTVPANGLSAQEVPPDTVVVKGNKVEMPSSTEIIHRLRAWSKRGDSDWGLCSPDYQSRLDWMLPSDSISGVQLREIKRGVDGCHELVFVNDQSMLLCAPWEALSFINRTWWVEAGEDIQDHAHTLQIKFYSSLDDYQGDRADVMVEGLRDWAEEATFSYPLIPVRGCEPLMGVCGQSSLPLAVELDTDQLEALNLDDGQPPLRLMDLAPGKHHWLLTAEREVVRDIDCEEPQRFQQNIPGYYLENFIVTHLGGE